MAGREEQRCRRNSGVFCPVGISVEGGDPPTPLVCPAGSHLTSGSPGECLLACTWPGPGSPGAGASVRLPARRSEPGWLDADSIAGPGSRETSFSSVSSGPGSHGARFAQRVAYTQPG